jgi:hypothetical protein
MYFRPIFPPRSDVYPLLLLLFRFSLLSLHSSFACFRAHRLQILLHPHVVQLPCSTTLIIPSFSRAFMTFCSSKPVFQFFRIRSLIHSFCTSFNHIKYSVYFLLAQEGHSKHIPGYFPENYIQFRKGVN